jgi:hypothetical protein
MTELRSRVSNGDAFFGACENYLNTFTQQSAKWTFWLAYQRDFPVFCSDPWLFPNFSFLLLAKLRLQTLYQLGRLCSPCFSYVLVGLLLCLELLRPECY